MMRRTPCLIVAIVAALTIGGAAVAGAAASKSVRVKLSDFKVTPAKKSTRHGRVTFVVRNAGKVEHELVVIKTRRRAAKLPMDGDEASEKGEVGEVEDIARGKTKRLTLRLKKGHYALICNIGGHYEAGMHADLTVR